QSSPVRKFLHSVPPRFRKVARAGSSRQQGGRRDPLPSDEHTTTRILKFIAREVEDLMRVSRPIAALTAALTCLWLLTIPNLAAPQGITSLSATAHGKGTLTVGKEVFKVGAVVVKLKEDGTGEIT